ncbi:hypothetical protein [Bounagaea algeriensis]
MRQAPQGRTERITSWPRLIGLLLLLVGIIVGGSIAATVALPADPAVAPERYVASYRPPQGSGLTVDDATAAVREVREAS